MGEKLLTATELENHRNKIAIKVLKENEAVGHVLRDISKYYTSVPFCGGTIKCKMIG